MKASRRCSTNSSRTPTSTRSSSPPSLTAAASPGGRCPDSRCPITASRSTTRDTFKGGSYTRMHPQYYRDTVLQNFRAPDFGDYDVLEAVLPAARKRGMKTICWFEDVWSRDVPNVAQAQEKQLDGSNADHPVLQQSQLPELAAGHGGGLRALLRDRRHHVGLGAAGRVLQCAGRAGVQPAAASPASASSASARRESAASMWTRARAGFQALGEFVRARGQASGGWLLRHAVAADAALSRTAGLGECSGPTACAKLTRRFTPR